MTGRKVLTPEVWALVEQDYKAGIKPLEVICETYGVKYGTLTQMASRKGWKRDLVTRVRQRMESKLFAQELRQVGKPQHTGKVQLSPEAEDRAVVEAAALMQVNIINLHRTRITQASKTCDGLLAELTSQAMTEEELRRVCELVSLAEDQTDDKQADPAKVEARVRAFKKLLSLSSRADVLKKLADALKTLIGLERQAFGIADNANGDANGKTGEDEAKPVELTPNEAARRVAFALLMGTQHSTETKQ